MIRIRLAKIGKRNAPTYRVVVANQRDKRNGIFLDILASYNPQGTTKPSIDKKKYNEWIQKGAQPSVAVQKLMDGKYEFKPYLKTKKKIESEATPKSEVDSEASSE
jgi:small subunit ribosomal protein S16